VAAVLSLGLKNLLSLKVTSWTGCWCPFMLMNGSSLGQLDHQSSIKAYRSNYKILHMNKAGLERLGVLPQSIEMMEDAADNLWNANDDDSKSD
jgi:hypothetical protein